VADLDFFFDAGCPWAWITSRWVVEVQALRSYDVSWRFISLLMVNEQLAPEHYSAGRRASHMGGLHVHRVCDEVRLRRGNEAVGSLYTAVGEAFHKGRRRPEITDDPVAFMAEMLATAGLPTEWAAAALDEAHDGHIRADTELALSRTGRDVGTPIVTFRPGRPDEGSFFGPVMCSIPRGDIALRLWDAVEVVATTPGVSELKRSERGKPDFA
jgi:hypothetical protein